MGPRSDSSAIFSAPIAHGADDPAHLPALGGQHIFGPGRMKRIVANHLEGMAVFTPLILIAHFGGISTPLTIWGAVLFFFARAAFAVIYMIGVPVLRSAVWGVGFTGLLMIGFELAKTVF